MVWLYSAGTEGEVDPEDIWHPMPDSAGWDGHGWTDGYESGGGTLPASSDGIVAAWPDMGALAPNSPEARFARPAIKFVLQARRFRFITPGGAMPPRRFRGRPDQLAGGAQRWAPHPKSVQGGRRWGGAVI